MMTDVPFDPAAYAQVMATALDLPLTDVTRPAVVANVALAFKLAPLFVDFELADDLEPAPVFHAGDVRD
jgi:Protein of unknown function (DUF4089)